MCFWTIPMQVFLPRCHSILALTHGNHISEIPQSPSTSQKVTDCWKTTEIYSLLEMNQKADHHSVASIWFSRALYKKYKVQKQPKRALGSRGQSHHSWNYYREHPWTSDCVTEEHTSMTELWLLQSNQQQALRDSQQIQVGEMQMCNNNRFICPKMCIDAKEGTSTSCDYLEEGIRCI